MANLEETEISKTREHRTRPFPGSVTCKPNIGSDTCYTAVLTLYTGVLPHKAADDQTRNTNRLLDQIAQLVLQGVPPGTLSVCTVEIDSRPVDRASF